jgi:hypothetical protein
MGGTLCDLKLTITIIEFLIFTILKINTFEEGKETPQ